MFEVIQQEHDEWLKRMFPGPRPNHHGVLGAMEELSELVDATLEHEALDAIADMAIFLISWCNSNDTRCPEPKPHVVVSVHMSLMSELGRMARAQLKMEQAKLYGAEPRYKDRDFKKEAVECVARTFHVLYVMAHEYGRELEPLVTTIWDRVKERSRA